MLSQHRLVKGGLTKDLAGGLRSVWLNGIGGSPLLPRVLRHVIYQWGGIETRLNDLFPRIVFLGGGPVRLGRGVSINCGVTFDNKEAPIELEDSVYVGNDVLFLTSTHELRLDRPERRAGQHRFEPIRVGEGTWIGARAVIMPGVEIGPGCVIASGAVVYANCPANGTYAGNPARRTRDLPTELDEAEA